jgi:CheY-like chemotaxis protein
MHEIQPIRLHLHFESRAIRAFPECVREGMRAIAAPQGGNGARKMRGHTMDKPRILIVDDNHMLTDMWRMLFGVAGRFDIGIENDGEAALETARMFRPDLIFMDVCLSGSDGREIAAELETDPALKSVPVVFLTGLSREEAAVCYGSGNHMVLTKPVELREILACAEMYFPGAVLEAA